MLYPPGSAALSLPQPHLALDHSRENRAEVLHVSALQLRHDPRVQQHQAEPPEGWLHLHHQRVAQVHDGRPLPAAGAGLGRALHQDVPGVQVSVHKVVNKDLEDRQASEQPIPTKPAHAKPQANSVGLFPDCSLPLLTHITSGGNTVNGFCCRSTLLKQGRYCSLRVSQQSRVKQPCHLLEVR